MAGVNGTMQLGRLLLGPPGQAIAELIGDPVGQTGGSVVATSRAPQTLQIMLNTILSGASSLANAQTLRRQLRALLANTPLKLQGFVYLVYVDDSEMNGWLIPDPLTLQSPDGTAFKAVGLWTSQGTNWWIAGHQRTNREARSIWMKDLGTGLYERDTLGMVVSTDFSALPQLALNVLPNGAVDPVNNVSQYVALTSTLPTGRDGGTCLQVAGLSDLAVVSYERPESALNLSDVIVYDRRGQITAPSTGPDTSWEEVCGNDYPWNWLTVGQPNDAPVLDNGLVRVRYDISVGKPGFRVDLWTGAAYVEQGKLTLVRLGDSNLFETVFASASMYAYTPERAVVMIVLKSLDAGSSERVFITMARGELGLTFECYPALKIDGVTPADLEFLWTPVLGDVNDSVLKMDSQTQPPPVGNGKVLATAGSGSSAFTTSVLGAATFSASENYVALLRCSATATIGPYQTNFALLQAAAVACSTVGTDTSAYGSAANAVVFSTATAIGYLQLQLGFAATVADQILEAESVTLGTNTTNTTDAAASAGHAATATRTTDANFHVSRATWPNGFLGVYRVFIRVKVSANSASFYAKTGATTGSTRSGINSTSYTWVDLGEITANNTTLEIHAWMSGGAGTVSVDRIEAYLVQDRVRSGAIYSGARDMGQAALYDSRQIGALTAR